MSFNFTFLGVETSNTTWQDNFVMAFTCLWPDSVLLMERPSRKTTLKLVPTSILMQRVRNAKIILKWIVNANFPTWYIFTIIGCKNAFAFLETEPRPQRELESPDCEDCNRKCGGIIEFECGANQIIRSLNTTSDLYDPNLECLWLIESDRRSQIRLTITSFELESGMAKMCPSCDDATCP